VAIGLDRVQQHGRQHLGPAALGGDVVDGVEPAFPRQAHQHAGRVELRRQRRIAGGDALERDGARLFRCRHRELAPLATGGAVGLGQSLLGGRLARGGPPVHDVGRRPGLGRGGQQGRGESAQQHPGIITDN